MIFSNSTGVNSWLFSYILIFLQNKNNTIETRKVNPLDFLEIQDSW